MSQPTPSDRVLFLVSGYVLGTLEAAESTEFAQLISQDSTILREVDQLQQALEDAYDIVERDPPPQLREKVLAAASLIAPEVVAPGVVAPEVRPKFTVGSQLPALSPSASPSPALSSPVLASAAEPVPEALYSRSPSVLRSLMRLLWIATAIAIAALGISNYILWRQVKQQIAARPDPSALELPTSNPLTYTLESTAAAKAATAKVTVYPDTLTAELDTSRLPQLPPDQVYALWAVLKPQAPFTTDNKGAVLATTFKVDEQGEVSKAIAVPNVFQQPQVIAALGVTVESASAPQSHAGDPVLLAKLP